MFDPLTVGVGLLAWKLLKDSTQTDFGAMTPQREEIFKNALEHLHDPPRLRDLAQAFEKQGLKAQGAVLRRRADWRARDEATKKRHEDIYQKALNSKNIAGIMEVARAFELMTATVKAKALIEHAERLKATESVQPATVIVEKVTPAEPSKPEAKPEPKPEPKAVIETTGQTVPVQS